MLAMQRHKTMLIDADMHNAGLSPMLAGGWQRGLADTLAGDFDPSRDLLAHPSLPLRFLPGAGHDQQTLTEPVQALEDMVGFLPGVGSKFDYVVVDLPPIAVVGDVRSFVHHLDAVVLVIEWGSTARRFVRESVENDPILADKCIGVLLNKVDQRKLKRYQKYGSSEFYSSRYQQYYHTERSANLPHRRQSTGDDREVSDAI
jgi:Mrp family chromosome partitioning ATPase